MKNLFVNKSIQRVLFYGLIVVVILNRHYMLLMYSFVFYGSFEYLNQNNRYTELIKHNQYNWIFLLFLAFIVWVRTRSYTFSQSVEFHLNTMEHIFFALTICLLLSVYVQLFGVFKENKTKNVFLVCVAFNLIGLLNEFVQNYFRLTHFSTLELSNIKDVLVNLIGSSLFLIFSIQYKFKKNS